MKYLTLLMLGLTLFCFKIAAEEIAPWKYDEALDLNDPMHRELLDIVNRMPNMPAISDVMMPKQKFRPAFGPVPWRMLLSKDSIKVLFMGQDATHIAEAAGRPGTAGFGGRAHDVAKYLGVFESAGFTNSFPYTIKGQYGAYNSPYFKIDGQGSPKLKLANIVPSNLWVLANDPKSPIGKWRNEFIDWIIRNNKNSLKLIVTFGGAARDAVGSYIKSKKEGDILPFLHHSRHRLKVPEMDEKYAGGNNTFPALIDKNGGSYYKQLLGRRPKYDNTKDTQEIMEKLKENAEEAYHELMFTDGGPDKNGLMNTAQVSGYNFNSIQINGKKTRSLKGISLNDDSQLENDLLVVELPHPSFLSRIKDKNEASEHVNRRLNVLKPYFDEGWSIEPDEGLTNQFAEGKSYVYGRSGLPSSHYDFGTPKNRQVPVSSAVRMRKRPHGITFGTRKRVKYDEQKVEELTQAQPAEELNPNEVFVTRPRLEPETSQFDRGPGRELAKILKENLDLDEIFTEYDIGPEEEFIRKYDVKSAPNLEDFGHYRGKVKDAKAIILADPIGYDDIGTSKALTGERGQYLHGMLKALGFADEYIILKTVPFAMDGADDGEWERTLERTHDYRKKALAWLLKNNKPEIIITDGRHASAEINSLLPRSARSLPIVSIQRSQGNAKYGLQAAQEKIAKITKRKASPPRIKRANIPRSHLSFYSQLWQGTSGDRVITTEDKDEKGKSFAILVPAWAYQQQHRCLEDNWEDIRQSVQKLIDNNLIRNSRDMEKLLKRLDQKLQ